MLEPDKQMFTTIYNLQQIVKTRFETVRGKKGIVLVFKTRI